MTATGPALAELARRYASRTENVGHYERDPGLSGPDPVGHLRHVVDLRRAEVAGWAQEWRPHWEGSPGRVLDAGCGPGTVTLALAAHYSDAEVLGIDVEPEAVELARGLAGDEARIDFRLLSLEDLPADLEPFDLIVCRTTLEHVREPRRAFDRLVGLLGPGGALFLETPNYLFPYEPHVRVWMLPKSPKWLLAAQCRALGRDAAFVEHLRFACDPITFRRWARRHAVDVVDLSQAKAGRLLRGEIDAATDARQRAIRALSRFPRARRAAERLAALPLLPSVRLLVVRRSP